MHSDESKRLLEALCRSTRNNMRSPAQIAPRRFVGYFGLALLGVFVAFGIGVSIGWSKREKPLLAATVDAAAVDLGGVQQLATAKDQYFAAMMASLSTEGAAPLGTQEAGFKAVLQYFPETDENAVYRCRAKQQLARNDLLQDRYDEARMLYDQLAAADDVDFQSIGVAGQCVVLYYQGARDDAAQKLVDLAPLFARLEDGKLRQTIIADVYPSLRKTWNAEQTKTPAADVKSLDDAFAR
jgi:hypothetical protein